MKKFVLICFSLISFSITFSQREKFDCNNLSQSKVLYEYSNLKQYGLETLFKSNDGRTRDAMEVALYSLDSGDLRQLCINAWGEVKNNGEEYCYTRYTKTIGYVPKNLYIQNIDYFEMLREVKSIVNGL